MNVESKRWMALVGVFYNHRAEYFSLKWKQLKKDKAMNADLILRLRAVSRLCCSSKP